MKLLFRRFPLILLAAFLVAPVVAWAGGEATINAMAYKPLPEGKAVRVQPLDNSDQNMTLKAQIEKDLEAQGYTVAEEAPLTLIFETRNEGGAWTDNGRRTFLELEARGGGLGGDEQRAQVNLFNSTRGGLLNKGEGGTRVVTPYHYRLDFSLEKTESGDRLWQAWGTANTEESEAMPAMRAMLPTMVDNIGQTVRSESVKIP